LNVDINTDNRTEFSVTPTSLSKFFDDAQRLIAKNLKFHKETTISNTMTAPLDVYSGGTPKRTFSITTARVSDQALARALSAAAISASAGSSIISN